MIRLLVALALACSSLILLSPPAHACSCVRSTTAEQAERASYVFTGKVAATTSLSSRQGALVFDVAVDEVFKGDVPEAVHVQSSESSASCGLGRLPEGRSLVFFAGDEALFGSRAPSTDGEGMLYSYLCDGTGPAGPALVADVTAALGEPATPSARVDDEREPDSGTEAVGGPTEAVDSPGSDDGALLWPWLVGLLALATGAASYAARRTA